MVRIRSKVDGAKRLELAVHSTASGVRLGYHMKRRVMHYGRCRRLSDMSAGFADLR